MPGRGDGFEPCEMTRRRSPSAGAGRTWPRSKFLHRASTSALTEIASHQPLHYPFIGSPGAAPDRRAAPRRAAPRRSGTMVGRWGCIVAALVAIATAKPNRDCEFDCHGGKCVYEGCEDVTCRGGACEFLECTRPTCDGARAARAAAGFVRGVEADRSQAARASFDGASTRSARAAGPGPASGAPTAPRVATRGRAGASSSTRRRRSARATATAATASSRAASGRRSCRTCSPTEPARVLEVAARAVLLCPRPRRVA